MEVKFWEKLKYVFHYLCCKVSSKKKTNISTLNFEKTIFFKNGDDDTKIKLLTDLIMASSLSDISMDSVTSAISVSRVSLFASSASSIPINKI